MKIKGRRISLRHSPLRLLEGWIAARLALPPPKRPAFIIGCGRSGTTILGKSLARHPKIAYLNEQRHLWYSCYPETDISSHLRERRGGRLWLDAADARTDASHKLHSLFRLQCYKQRAPQLLDKLPANTLRIGLITAIFPDARFIHIVRDGREVARSITRKLDRGSWFAKNPIKWTELRRLGRERLGLNVDLLCQSNYEKALLEWTVNTQAAVAAMNQSAPGTFLEVSYQEFVDEPGHTIARCLDFLQLPASTEVQDYVSSQVRRRHRPIEEQDFSPRELAIAGDLLRRYANS